MTTPTSNQNIGGYLPKEIPIPKFSDPNHRTKCISGVLFELVKSVKSMKKLDALILKKYYSYYIKMNIKRLLRIL